MLQPTWKDTAGALVALMIAAAGVAAADIPAKRPARQSTSVTHLPAKAARMYGFVTKPHPGELKWQQIPWLTDLRAAIRHARAERRPLLLFVSGDDPLEKC